MKESKNLKTKFEVQSWSNFRKNVSYITNTYIWNVQVYKNHFQINLINCLGKLIRDELNHIIDLYFSERIALPYKPVLSTAHALA